MIKNLLNKALFFAFVLACYFLAEHLKEKRLQRKRQRYYEKVQRYCKYITKNIVWHSICYV
jgi:hypothetical protein